MRPPADVEIHAPEFPPRLPWLNVAFLRMDKLLAQNAVLVEFWDFARVNSLRTMPYLKGWHARYASRGLRVVGIHTPGYSFGRDPDAVAREAGRLEVPYPVVIDSDYQIWRLYGNRGWPGRYLWDRRGLLRYYHYGEGDYDGTELAIQEVLVEIDDFPMPEPLEPLKPEDVPGMRLEAQTADIALPRERDRLELVRDWTDGEDYIEAADAGAAASVRFRAGSAYAVLSEGGLDHAGLYDTDGTVVADDPGLRLHGFQFTPLPPA